MFSFVFSGSLARETVAGTAVVNLWEVSKLRCLKNVFVLLMRTATKNTRAWPVLYRFSTSFARNFELILISYFKVTSVKENASILML